jgi:hypothetical protein
MLMATQNAKFKMRNGSCRSCASARLTCLLLLVAFCVMARSASATVLLPADFTTVVAESATIVHGRVVDVSAGLTGPRRTIESLVTVQVIESLKGASTTDATVTFRVPNGQVGRYRRVLIGAPEFARGDEIVVFLHGQAPAIPTLFGLSQGVYRVVRDARAAPVVIPAPVSARGIGVERVVRGDPVRRPMPVDEFVRHVHTILERRR